MNWEKIKEKVKLSFVKMFQFREVLVIFRSLLLLRRVFSADFLFVNRAIIFLELFTDEPIR